MGALHGSQLKGATIMVLPFPSQSARDATKLLVTGLTPGTTWQELKAHFAQAGQVAFVNVKWQRPGTSDTKPTASGWSEFRSIGLPCGCSSLMFFRNRGVHCYVYSRLSEDVP